MVKKIDFHLHTISSIKDSDFTYSTKWIQDYIKEANLDAIADTNHDLFDKENFNQVKQDLPNTEVFPGIELSLELGHVNIVFPVECIDELSSFSGWLSEQHTTKTDSITVEELKTKLPCWNQGIYIFEMGKSKSSDMYVQDFQEVTKVGGVRNQLYFQRVFLDSNELTPVLFSDGHATDQDYDPDRNNIDKLKNKNTYLQIDNCTFNEIKNCIEDRTKVSLNPENLQNVISINDHNVSRGLNLVVGKRGTGKSHFLNDIKGQFDSDDVFSIG